MTRFRLLPLPLALIATLAWSSGAKALDSVEFLAPGADKATITVLRQASALLGQGKVSKRSAEELFADARADYGRLIDALYALGYYGPTIHVWVNGREAAGFAPLEAPAQITSIRIEVATGPQFRFSRARVAPLARGARMPADFAPGEVAEAGRIQAAVTAGIDGWRDLGHAKAAVASQDIVADHRDATLSADIGLAPGPVLRFGPLAVQGAQRLREARVVKIAGLATGQRYAPTELDRAAERLRRSGVFTSVSLVEDEGITPPDLLGVTAELVEAPLRHYSLGAEIASLDGAKVTARWLHRNLFGGGERLTLSGEVANIGAQSSGLDYALGVTLDRPATPGPDTSASIAVDVAHQDEADYQADSLQTGLTFTHWFGERLTGHWGLSYGFAQGRDLVGGDFLFQTVSAPIGLTWDNRNSAMDATRGAYADLTAKPFLGFGTTETGARLTLDARGYRGLGQGGFTLAGRVQLGAILGASALGTPRDDLFYSGGGGTVRGLPYQSLGAEVVQGTTPVQIGGTRFVGGSLEGRMRLNETWGAVAFLDAGLVDIGGFAPLADNWQAGAGLGLRYQTGFGPIRLDLGMPVHGGTGDGLQLYVGLGQAF